MRMSADHNWNLQHGGVFPQLFCNQNVVSFQSGAVNSTSGLMTGAMNSAGSISSTAGMILPGNPSIINNTSSVMASGSSSGNMLLDSIHGLKHGTSLAVDWSYEELLILKQGLITYDNETNIMKYIKIAAMLPEKTVRDVAMRCRWMTKKESGKRRKPDDNFSGKKMKDRKEKMVDSSSMENILSIQPENTGACVFTVHDSNQTNQFPCQAPALDTGTWSLLNENIGLLKLIVSNLVTNKVQENINLFYRTRDNITNILNSMSEMPGIMSQMPVLPVSINENLLHSLCPNASQEHAPGSSHFKEGPRCW